MILVCIHNNALYVVYIASNSYSRIFRVYRNVTIIIIIIIIINDVEYWQYDVFTR